MTIRKRITSPFEPGQEVFILREEQLWEDVGTCPACEGSGILVALDDSKQMCSGGRRDSGECFSGRLRVPRKRRRVIKVEVTRMEFWWTQHDFEPTKVRVYWVGGRTGSRRMSEDYDPVRGDIFTTEDEALRRLAGYRQWEEEDEDDDLEVRDDVSAE